MINRCLKKASGEIILISDANSKFAPESVNQLVGNFADPNIGAVTGEEIRRASDACEGYGESLYNRLDNWIKRYEGQTGSVVMVNGGFFAIRGELCPIVEPHLILDAIVPCALKLNGYRTVYEPQAISIEDYPLDAGSDFRRRLRTVIQAFYSYMSIPQALNPFRTGWFAFKLFSHRFTRWFVFPWMLVALLTNLLLVSISPIYSTLFIVQLICFSCAIIGWILEKFDKRIKLFYIPYYYVYIHLAAFIAVLQALSGKRVATWVPSTRENFGDLTE
jgi:cellulose synthase/poly-beta-1,6-N-acetylglucosamine synthase-like glycosyltransferase